MKYYCNPLNIDYRYQFNIDQQDGGKLKIGREAADPSMIYFKNKYYIFASMNLKVWVSDDLASWESYPLPENLPLYDYAPDARVVGDYVYLCASRREQACSFFRTKDILKGPYEEISGDFAFWDPNLFIDDDGRMYFYWGCTNTDPIWGVEKDPLTMKNIGEPAGLIYGDAASKGYERTGDDNGNDPGNPEEVEKQYQEWLNVQTQKETVKNFGPMMRGIFTHAPFIEGAWMTKYEGKYYLQYASPGTEYNVYNDGVYVSDKPLGPFHLQKNNPFSMKPGGFMTGAGHGSTMKDRNENWWHTATMRISQNFNFERRVGLWPAGFDKDGELFCNQRYGDWPAAVDEKKLDPWSDPSWYLMSYNAKICASSFMEGREPEKAVDENVRTWWRAAGNQPGEWLKMDLGGRKEVHFIQINFADEGIQAEPAGKIHGGTVSRWIDDRPHYTRWKLEGSLNEKDWFMLEDKTQTRTDLPHDCLIFEQGKEIRYLKLTVIELPYDQNAAVSGLRVFGIGHGKKPEAPSFRVERIGEKDMRVVIEGDNNSVGYNILWGESIDKLYHSWMIYGKKEQQIGALVKNEKYYVRVDAFNENGISKGNTVEVC